MIEKFEPLIFNWKLNEATIKEEFLDTSYNPAEDGYEICDYIFQKHSVWNSFRFEELQRKGEAVSSIASEYFSINLLLDDSFLETVSCLKSMYASLFRFYGLCGDLEWFRNSESGMKSFDTRTSIIFEEPSRIHFYSYLLFDLSNAMDLFKRKKDSSGIEVWLKNTRKKIQEKANEIAVEMEKLYKDDLWEDLDAFLKKDCNGSELSSWRTSIDSFMKESIDVIKKLKIITEGYDKYVKKNGCYALCVADEKKIYSLSGTNDYNGKWKGHPCLQSSDSLDIDQLRNILMPKTDFIYAPLTDEVMCYGLKSLENMSCPYFYKPEQMKIAIELHHDLFQYKDVTCCERKILAKKPKANAYKFFIRREPCFLCQPAMASKNIVSYVPSNDRKKLRKLKVERGLFSNSYEIKDIP